ncbi:hypothetical protein MPRF_37530 [Mycolicibacterium parafortuitum]|uniref:FAD dependent oxidoreductase domain-containing protein n=1 Tax=Mycolicibacterium parafortuitum TaxID=39692 RepID=A0A7I7U643_MYCPF|nr:hypothetical protein MPRF_37530 [Mycolicibacterium parafortuitum]
MRALAPLIDRDRILGGFHTPDDGLAKALRAAEAQALRARARGATFRPHTEVLGILDDGRRVTGVRTAEGVLDADVVVCAAGFWGAHLARQVGLTLPLVPMAHQYARTGQISARRTQHRTRRGRPADPASPGPGPVLPGARRPSRYRLLQPSADAGRHGHPVRRHRG